MGLWGFFGCPKSDDQRLDSQEIKQVQGEIKFKVGRYGNMGCQIFKGGMQNQIDFRPKIKQEIVKVHIF